ncbi:MAG: hypothetical protein IPO70_01330 [Bacteroidetes bacterium]|nr:hypothetical protein [Bacteroidota bacterium]
MEKISSLDTSVEFEIERRTLENVTRKRKIIGTVTILNGMTSLIRFEQIDNLSVSGLSENYRHNHFLDSIELDNDGKLKIKSVNGLLIQMNTSKKTKIILLDLRESEFGKGKVFGKTGFTADEWTEYLKEKSYSDSRT